MKNRSVRGTSFNIPSNRNLWKTLGAHDAIVEFIECSCRTFLNKYEVEGGDFNGFLTKESKNVGIYLRDISLINYRNIINSSYFIFPYACFDEFITDYINDVRDLINKDFQLKQKDDATRFERLLIALKDIGINPDISKAKKDLFDYYRLVRNVISHGGDNDLKNIYKKIDRKKIKEIYPTLSEPQSEDQIDFDDFILCTANIKNIADILTVSLESHINWKEFTIHNKCLFPRRAKFNYKRKKVYIKNCIFSKYSVLLEDNIYDEIIGSLE